MGSGVIVFWADVGDGEMKIMEAKAWTRALESSIFSKAPGRGLQDRITIMRSI